MPISFIHLSDIHFGQEVGSDKVVHNDVKEQVIRDANRAVKGLRSGFASGIIVSGDIAYGGKADEYAEAAAWLDRMAIAAGCAISDIQVVPGNHDIDRDEISHGTALMLKEISDEGEAKLDTFLNRRVDCDALYKRFAAYEPFARGYNSPLEVDGGRAGARTVELAPGRFLRFVGLNTALACAGKDVKGNLLLGKRQRVLNTQAGCELVVIAHHPLDWLRDSDDARRFLNARARVFISGHEHFPAVSVHSPGNGGDLMMLAAGAVVPPHAEGKYTYKYNLIEFDWDPAQDGLVVTLHPRTWIDEQKQFGPDPDGLGEATPTFRLACPYFREGAPPVVPSDPASAVPLPLSGSLLAVASASASTDAEVALAPASPPVKPVVPVIREEGVTEVRKEPSVPAQFSLLRLRFFRDLTGAQRVLVLSRLGVLPEGASESLSHALEQRILDTVQRTGRLDELQTALDAIKPFAMPGDKPA
ncbi:metallophosphoesterase [Rhizobacter sp. P5_C2]